MNTIRGEVTLEIGDTRYQLCLTLGALAEIESGLGVESLSDLQGRFSAPRSEDLLIVLSALLCGGGHDLSPSEVGRLPVKLPDAISAIRETFVAAGLSASAVQDKQ